MNTWAPLWSGIVESSIWDEPDFVVKVFMTMLAVKDADHVVRFNAYQLGRKSRKSEVEVLEALKILSGPDKRRKESQEFDGRRIKAVEDGWLVLNGQKYKEMMSREAKRRRDAKAQAAYRARKKSRPLTGEAESIAAANKGLGEVAEIIEKNHEQEIARRLGRDELKEDAVPYHVNALS